MIENEIYCYVNGFLKLNISKEKFISQIKNASLSKQFLVSYDVASLFTKIPLQEIIDIAVNLIFNYNHNLNITRKELKKTFPFHYITDSFYF